MDAIKTISQLLTQSGCDYAIYDLGRRIEVIPNQEFEQVEQSRLPYPYPVQRQAQFAITYWNEAGEPWFWFLKFDLDERGLLNSADLGNFLKYVVDAMGSRLQKNLTDEQQEQLANNPYTVKPKEDKLAMFNSIVRTRLDLPASQYLDHADHYFQGQLGWDNWQTVGLQGITDLAARLSFAQNERTIKKALSHLPNQPLYALLGALEHCQISSSLANRLLDRFDDELKKPEVDLFLVTALLRAMAGDKSDALPTALNTVLSRPELCHPEMMIAIAGRSWSPLGTESVAEQYLIRLAQTQQQTLFNQLFADLVMIPKLRLVLLPLLNQAPSAELEQALLALQRTTTQGS
ncbi:DUF3549 family protein [Vibrio ulleungensis]|uniref:DUF3549 family protein n=1 Tax=Vibrio ulleungensis TaxID=2807619 RepID=A0ABS2HKX5_9VIBR|nr:DUF3549 family protein [Vibrio ulleungensis]MBM7038148.1 DUF3549 family protein [Vibrio ulleungensis]